jgi:hypothetical protein
MPEAQTDIQTNTQTDVKGGKDALCKGREDGIGLHARIATHKQTEIQTQTETWTNTHTHTHTHTHTSRAG